MCLRLALFSCLSASGVTSLRLTSLERGVEKCPGSGDDCSGDQCCPGYEGSTWLTFPCPNAAEGWNRCQTEERFLNSSASSTDEPQVSAVGDPHLTSVTGETFDLWKTGWSTFVQIPKDAQGNRALLILTGNVKSHGSHRCAPTFLEELQISGSSVAYNQILLRAGSLESAVPFGVSVNGSNFKTIDDPSGTDLYLGRKFTMRGKIVDDEPGVWGPDVKFVAKVGDFEIQVKQHTKGRGANSSSMLDLSVSGLDGVDSIGGWLGVGGSSEAGEPPLECADLTLLSVGGEVSYKPSSIVSFRSARSMK